MRTHHPCLALRRLYLRAALAFLVSMLSAGCVIFEKQTMVAIVRPDLDEARVLFVYEGLHSNADKDELDKDRQTLTTMFKDKQGFYLGHPWLFQFLEITKLLSPEVEPEFQKKVRTHVKNHVTVTDASMFLNKEGKLCGSQTLKVRNLGKFVDGVNGFISETFLQDIAKGLADEKQRGKIWDTESMLILQKAAKEGHAWIRTEPGRIEFTLLGRQPLFSSLKREILNDQPRGKAAVEVKVDGQEGPAPLTLDKTTPSPEELQKQLAECQKLIRFLVETPLSVNHRHDRMVLSLGVGNGEPASIWFDYGAQSEQKADALMLTHARTLVGELSKEVSAEIVIHVFLKKHIGTKSVK